MSLFQKNIVFLQTAVPALASLAGKTTDTLTKAVMDSSGIAVDIDLGGGRLYNRPAAEFAQEQVLSWLRQPNRVVVNRPEPESMKDEAGKTLSMRLSDEVGDDLLAFPPTDESGLLVVIGIGLGQHIRDLVKKVGPRHLVLIESISEFVVHSLHALDWASLIQDCQAQGTTVDVIVDSDPRVVKTELEELITHFGAYCVDGAYSFLHFQTDVSRAIARDFQELAGMKTILQGYYADEKLMIENTIANVTGEEFWMIDGAPQKTHDMPAFIIGSGPSLDGALDTIREWQDHAVIFCAGSALQSLLAAGIKPDFQIEKENNEQTRKRMEHIFERHGAGADRFDISLIGSVTVKPAVFDLFGDTFLFHREMLSSTRMFGKGFNPLLATGPFSANTAVSAATILGFRNMYMFGCDCGSVDRGQHHARDTVYYTRDGHTSGHANLPLPVPANFGGQAWSNPYFLWSRWVFESMISQAEISAVNCSDGVAIQGATPIRPADLEMPRNVLNKEKVLSALKKSCLYQAPGSYLQGQNLPDVLDRWNRFAADLRQFCAEVLPQAKSLHDLDGALARFVETRDLTYDGILVPIEGSMRAMVPVGGYFLNRVAEPQDRARLLDVFRDVFDEEVERMLADCTAMLAGIAAGHGDSREIQVAS